MFLNRLFMRIFKKKGGIDVENPNEEVKDEAKEEPKDKTKEETRVEETKDEAGDEEVKANDENAGDDQGKTEEDNPVDGTQEDPQPEDNTTGEEVANEVGADVQDVVQQSAAEAELRQEISELKVLVSALNEQVLAVKMLVIENTKQPEEVPSAQPGVAYTPNKNFFDFS